MTIQTLRKASVASKALVPWASSGQCGLNLVINVIKAQMVLLVNGVRLFGIKTTRIAGLPIKLFSLFAEGVFIDQ